MRRLLVAVLLTVALSGCIDPYRPVVPEALWQDSPHAWTEDRRPVDGNGLFGADVVDTFYRFDGGNGPPFPAVMHVFGVRAFSRLSDEDLLDRTRAAIDDTLSAQGVFVDDSQERTGKRTLDSGVRTQWFRLVGTSEADAPIFTAQHEVRVLAEAWFDGASSTNVIVVALAQTTGPAGGAGGLFGQTTTDLRVWNELVGDPRGSINGAIHEDGFVYHMESHG